MALKELFLSYKTFLLEDGSIVDRAGFSVGGWCKFCTLILSDEPIDKDTLLKAY